MKNSLRLVLLLLLIMISFSALALIFYYGQLAKYQEIYTDVYVVSPGQGAFGIDKEENLRFGKISASNFGERKFNITTGIPIIVKIKTEGNISRFLLASQNNFRLNTGETAEITIKAEIPEGTPLGFYSGKIKVYFFKPWFK